MNSQRGKSRDPVVQELREWRVEKESHKSRWSRKDLSFGVSKK